MMEGQHVSAETSRRLACDSAQVVMTHASDGSVLDVGRRTRAIPPALRRALAARDGGCRFPGCGLKLCDAHHVEHWADGGATKLDNLLELCRRHHRAIHEEGYRVELLDGGEAVFRRPDGRVIPHAPPPPAVVDPLRGMLERVAGAGVTIDPAAVPTWDGSGCDYGWAVEWFRQAGASRARNGTIDDAELHRTRSRRSKAGRGARPRAQRGAHR